MTPPKRTFRFVEKMVDGVLTKVPVVVDTSPEIKTATKAERDAKLLSRAERRKLRGEVKRIPRKIRNRGLQKVNSSSMADLLRHKHIHEQARSGGQYPFNYKLKEHLK